MKSIPILRDLKLDILMGNQNKIIDKFKEITKDLKVINENVYNDDGKEFIFYNPNNEWIFYQDVKNERFWCNYNRYWSFFVNEFSLGYLEIKDLTKYLVEETLKLKVDTPMIPLFGLDIKVEETLKKINFYKQLLWIRKII